MLQPARLPAGCPWCVALVADAGRPAPPGQAGPGRRDLVSTRSCFRPSIGQERRGGRKSGPPGGQEWRMRANARRGARWLAGGWAVAVALAAALMAGPAQAAPAPFTYSSVAWTGTTAIVAGTDSAGDLYYWYEPDGGSTFTEQLVANGQHITGAPAIGWTGSTVIIAVSQGSQLDYWYQFAGTRSWHKQQVAAAKGTSYGPPAIGWTGKSVIIAAADSTHTLDYWYESADTGSWHEQLVLAGVYGVDYNTAFGPSIGWTGSTVIISSTDNFGGVDYLYQYAGTRHWHFQLVAAGIYPPFGGTAIGWTGRSVVITASDQYGHLGYWYQPAGTGTWHGQLVAKDVYENVPAIAWTGSSVVITAVSVRGNLEYWWQAAGTRPWNKEQVAHALGAGQEVNPSIAAAGDAVIITAVDGSGNLDYWSQQYGTGSWNKQQVAAG